jgi:hypothetical protein
LLAIGQKFEPAVRPFFIQVNVRGDRIFGVAAVSAAENAWISRSKA